MYWSRYDDAAIARFAERIMEAAKPRLASERRERDARALKPDVWCIFDNTAAGEAAVNAFELREKIAASSKGSVF